MYVYVIVLQQLIFFIPLFQRFCVTWPFYMYILNKSFISKEYTAVVDRKGDNFSDALALFLCWKIKCLWSWLGEEGGERERKKGL